MWPYYHHQASVRISLSVQLNDKHAAGYAMQQANRARSPHDGTALQKVATI